MPYFFFGVVVVVGTEGATVGTTVLENNVVKWHP